MHVICIKLAVNRLMMGGSYSFRMDWAIFIQRKHFVVHTLQSYPASHLTPPRTLIDIDVVNGIFYSRIWLQRVISHLHQVTCLSLYR